MTGASRARVLGAAALSLLALAPTPGDIGGCGQPAEELDQRVFLATLAATDCKRCRACGVHTSTCLDACAPATPPPTALPDGCAPLAHDGEVCLRRLLEASCGDYERYVADGEGGAPVPLLDRPRPSECLFCPLP